MASKTSDKLQSVTDNGDGTVTVRRRTADGALESRVMSMETQDGPDETDMEVLVRGDSEVGRKLGKGLSDCAFCQYGKPAIAGAVLGLGAASLTGYEPTRGVIWGGIGGLLYGFVRG